MKKSLQANGADRKSNKPTVYDVFKTASKTFAERSRVFLFAPGKRQPNLEPCGTGSAKPVGFQRQSNEELE